MIDCEGELIDLSFFFTRPKKFTMGDNTHVTDVRGPVHELTDLVFMRTKKIT